mgnify:CR=1 FL=1
MNERTKEDLVELINMDGEEWLRYKSFPLDIALIRGTYADEDGNCSMCKEAATLDSISIAQAVKNSGGKVILQVAKNCRTRIIKTNGCQDSRNLCGCNRSCKT